MIKKFDAFNIFYNRLMQDDNYLSKIEKEMIAVVVLLLIGVYNCCVFIAILENFSKIQ